MEMELYDQESFMACRRLFMKYKRLYATSPDYTSLERKYAKTGVINF